MNTVLQKLRIIVTGLVMIFLTTASDAVAQAGPGSPFSSGSSPAMPEPSFPQPETLPEFQGGMAGWNAFMSKNLNYPSEALKQKKEGRVFVQFKVDAQGVISNVQVVRSIGYGMDEEAVRLMNISPKWIPAIKNGRPTEFTYVLPVTFKLSTGNTTDTQ